MDVEKIKLDLSDDEGVETGSEYEDEDGLYYKNPPTQPKCCWLFGCGICCTACCQINRPLRWWSVWCAALMTFLALTGTMKFALGKYNERDIKITPAGHITYMLCVYFDVFKYVVSFIALKDDDVRSDDIETAVQRRAIWYDRMLWMWIGGTIVDFFSTWYSQDTEHFLYNGSHNIIDSKQSRNPARRWFKFIWFCGIYDAYIISHVMRQRGYLVKADNAKKNNMAWQIQEDARLHDMRV